MCDTQYTSIWGRHGCCHPVLRWHFSANASLHKYHACNLLANHVATWGTCHCSARRAIASRARVNSACSTRNVAPSTSKDTTPGWPPLLVSVWVVDRSKCTTAVSMECCSDDDTTRSTSHATDDNPGNWPQPRTHTSTHTHTHTHAHTHTRKTIQTQTGTRRHGQPSEHYALGSHGSVMDVVRVP